MTTYLITGSSRGLGLALSRNIASLPSTGIVFATARTSASTDLASLVLSSKGKVVFVQLEVTSPESVKAAAEEVAKHLNGKGLDILINNAGVAPASNGILSDMYMIPSTSMHSLASSELTPTGPIWNPSFA